jgi:hypothetical protein
MRRLWSAGVVLLAALALVPALLSAHTHSTSDMGHPCAICAVAHHVPLAVVSATTVITLDAGSGADGFRSRDIPGRVDPSLCDGRAPPRSSRNPSM